MKAVKLSGVLPEGDANGINSLARDVLDDPEALHLVIAVISTDHITHSVRDGESQPTMRFMRIESVGEQDSAEALRLMKRAYGRRTGQEMLPIALEDDIEDAFKGQSGLTP